jgi:C4-type Zn-finger protein
MTGPSCPSCQARPLKMDLFTGKFPNGIVASLVYCHDCGYVLPALQPVPADSGLRLVG